MCRVEFILPRSHVTQGNEISSTAEENIFLITTCNGQSAKRKKGERRKENVEGLHVNIRCLLNRTAHILAEIRSPGIGDSDVLA